MANEIDRSWNENFKLYTEMIVKHPNYRGLFYERDGADKRVKWVVTGKSENGQRRQKWWDKKCKELNIPIKSGCYAIAARAIHPTKKHVCQCCGRELSIMYEYPNKTLISKINTAFGLKLERIDYTIGEFIDKYCTDSYKIELIKSILGIKGNYSKLTLKQHIYNTFVLECKGPFSPGVMSNCPDRYDGFHSDGLCCREKTDKGRHSENMKTYTQDRRAYEEWADGDYNLANRLMGEFQKEEEKRCPICGEIKKMSADHIGPISLGFCHSIHFAPMCSSCNSSKNNRFTKSDVDKLIELENDGNQVVSWHSKYVWDRLKNHISNDAEAKLFSSIMVKCHQNVLKLFSMLHELECDDLLYSFLHPEYSMYDYRFENFDSMNLSKLKIIKTPLDSKNKRKNQERYIRIAFESLDDFAKKNNRKVTFVVDKYPKNDIVLDVFKGDLYNARIKVEKIIQDFSEDIIRQEWG